VSISGQKNHYLLAVQQSFHFDFLRRRSCPIVRLPY
jgi:hypothetical protein